MGTDALSNSLGIAIFDDGSWISDKGRFNARRGIFIPNEGESNNENYVTNINKVVTNKINMSYLLMSKNYYKYIFKDN